MESLDFASKSGFREYPQLLMNGVPIERENLGSRYLLLHLTFWSFGEIIKHPFFALLMTCIVIS